MRVYYYNMLRIHTRSSVMRLDRDRAGGHIKGTERARHLYGLRDDRHDPLVTRAAAAAAVVVKTLKNYLRNNIFFLRPPKRVYCVIYIIVSWDESSLNMVKSKYVIYNNYKHNLFGEIDGRRRLVRVRVEHRIDRVLLLCRDGFEYHWRRSSIGQRGDMCAGHDTLMHGAAAAAREGIRRTTATLKSLSVVRATDGFIGPAAGVFLYNTLAHTHTHLRVGYDGYVCECVYVIIIYVRRAHMR